MMPEITDEDELRYREIKREVRESNAVALTGRLNMIEQRFHEVNQRIDGLHNMIEQLRRRMDAEVQLRMQMLSKGTGPTT